ncbi:MAG: hypothetical protein IJJ94_08035 [Bacteroidaceae bacterium]|jgi:hypothetical protein|nr:hypothetical protein [Bacteroidaceae bacterium]MBQ7460772.1 hypothetical protein [Bacteroidaceae bacterium]
MENEELISKYVGQDNPFRTPDGYFESFTDRLMQRIQQQEQSEKPAPVITLSPWRRAMRWSAAAVVAALCIAGGTYLYVGADRFSSLARTEQSYENLSDEQLDEALDYEIACGLVDNNKISYYLTVAE